MEQLSSGRSGAHRQDRGEARGHLQEALGEIFGCSREGFGPLQFFVLPFFPPHETVTVCVGEGRWEEQKEECGQQVES